MTPMATAPKISKEQVSLKVIDRLKDCWPTIVGDTALELSLKDHLMRLPRRYALDIHNLDDLRTHMKLIEQAGKGGGAVVCDTRGVRLGSNNGMYGHAGSDIDIPMSPSSPGNALDSQVSVAEGGASSPAGRKKLRAPTFGSSFSLQTLDEAALDSATPSRKQRPAVYEIAVSGPNRPRMLSRVSTALFDIGLNITEAHVFCTEDGYALDVFVVQGWKGDDATNLNAHLQRRLATINWDEGVRPGTRVSEATEFPDGGEWEISEAQLSFSEKIASGAFGILYRGTYCGQEVAIKVLKSGEKNTQEEMYREFTQELSILRKVRHRNIVQLIGAMTRPPRLCLVTEFMKGGSLLQFLHKSAPLKQSQLLKIASGVASGMDYLHKINIIHRDLKAANLLLDDNEVVKVADFGVARVKSTDGSTMTAETGTYRWMAPEVIAHQFYNHKCDVFSYGILLWELVSGGEIPYPGYTPLQAAVGVVQRGLRPTIPASCHPVIAQVMQYSWQPDFNTRPEFEQILEMLKHIEVGEPAGGSEGSKSFFTRLRSISSKMRS